MATENGSTATTTATRPRTEVDANTPVSAEGVHQAYGDVSVLEGIDLQLDKGEIFGLIGPSGCGKTTLLRLVGGLERPSEGELLVHGKPPAEFEPEDRQRLGYVPQSFVLYENLSIEQNARFIAGLYGLGWRHRRRRVRELLEFFELWDVRKRPASAISGGMQRRLSIACALLHHPSLVLIDEPTAGLDPILRAKVWDHLKDLRAGGVTVFVTTQYIDEATHCDRIAIIRSGKIVAVGDPAEIRRQAGDGEALEVRARGVRQEDVHELWLAPGVNRVEWDGSERLRVLTPDSGVAIPAVTDILNEAGVEVDEIRTYIPTFEDAFVALMKSRKDGP